MTILESEIRYWKKNKELCEKSADEHHELRRTKLENYDKKQIEHLEKVVNWLEELRQLRKQTKWISVKENLPEEGVDVLVCDKYGDIKISRGGYITIETKTWCWDIDDFAFGEVIAWKPLPKPYETYSSVKEDARKAFNEWVFKQAEKALSKENKNEIK